MNAFRCCLAPSERFHFILCVFLACLCVIDEPLSRSVQEIICVERGVQYRYLRSFPFRFIDINEFPTSGAFTQAVLAGFLWSLLDSASLSESAQLVRQSDSGWRHCLSAHCPQRTHSGRVDGHETQTKRGTAITQTDKQPRVLKATQQALPGLMPTSQQKAFVRYMHACPHILYSTGHSTHTHTQAHTITRTHANTYPLTIRLTRARTHTQTHTCWAAAW